jgi:hypothetical protein
VQVPLGVLSPQEAASERGGKHSRYSTVVMGLFREAQRLMPTAVAHWARKARSLRPGPNRSTSHRRESDSHLRRDRPLRGLRRLTAMEGKSLYSCGLSGFPRVDARISNVCCRFAALTRPPEVRAGDVRASSTSGGAVRTRLVGGRHDGLELRRRVTANRRACSRLLSLLNIGETAGGWAGAHPPMPRYCYSVAWKWWASTWFATFIPSWIPSSTAVR